MKRRIISVMFWMEMRMVVRDRRAIFASIVLPLLVMPLVLFASHWSLKKHEAQLKTMTYRYAVSGAQAASVRALVAEAEQHAIRGTNEFHFKEVSCTDPVATLEKGELEFVLEGLTPAETQASEKKKAKDHWEKRAVVPSVKVEGVRLTYRADRDQSSMGMSRMRQALAEMRDARRVAMLEQKGFSVSQKQIATVSDVNLASRGQVAGLALGRNMTLLLLFFVFMGGAVVATDLLAGEKERGTLETLLTSAAGRGEIIAAKQLVILAVALVITLTQTAGLFVYAGLKVIPVPADLAAAVTPLNVAVLFMLYLPMTMLVASILLLASGYAKSYKEAQLYFLPVLLLGVAPALVSFFPGLELRSAIVLVPISNIAVAAKQVLIGAFDWPMLAISWLVTAAAALGVTRLSVRVLAAEKLVTSTGADAAGETAGVALFERHVWRWFVALWGVLLIVSNYTGTLDIRIQLPINLVVLFFGASLLMVRRYHLDVRETLALRMPKPMVWVAVLVAAPSGMLTGIGLFRLANLFFPIPAKVMESFAQAVLPQGMSTVQLVFFLAVLPAIFEEMTFRGVLLHGLHRRLHPVALVLVVGLVFGFFHMTLFRIAPTAFLGALLATVTLLTGSIFPAMLWHAVNNAMAVLQSDVQLAATELDPLAYVVSAGILACAFWIIWRNRTPYPGLKQSGKQR